MIKFVPGDVSIKKIEITNPRISAGVSIYEQVEGLDIWEDMEKPTLYATLLIQDSIGLFYDFPIIGEEDIEIVFQTPGLPLVTYNFKVFEIQNVTKSKEHTTLFYTLRCVSKEHFYNSASMVTQSYTGNISDIVPQVLSRYLKSQKDIIVDQTKGIQNIVVPRLAPFELIDMCRQRAVSALYPSSSYVFFEHQKGFVFKTVEGLIEQGKDNIGTRVFNVNQSSFINTMEKNGETLWRTLLGYEHIVNTNSLAQLVAGTYKSITKTFDVITKQVGTIEYNLQEHYDKFKKLDSKNRIPNTNEFIQELATKQPIQFFTPYSSSLPETFIKNTISARNSFTHLLNTDITRMKIHGDSGLKAGDVIAVNMPQVDGLAGSFETDNIVDTKYLIVRLRHMINCGIKPRHEIVCDAVKMGLNL